MELDTKTYWLTACQSQCDFDLSLTNSVANCQLRVGSSDELSKGGWEELEL
jgi:hypothetical protein